MTLGTQKTLTSFRRVQIRWLDTLQRLASRELGDATQWPTIATINNLVPPYLTGDLDQLRPGVLRYGDTLIIPGVNAEPEPGKTSAEEVFLCDVALPQGQLRIVDGDLAIVAGRANLKQALPIRVQTQPGELIFHPKYGCRVHEQKGRKNTAVAGLLAALYVREAVSRDARIQRVTASRAGVSGDVIDVEVQAETITGHPVDIETQV